MKSLIPVSIAVLLAGTPSPAAAISPFVPGEVLVIPRDAHDVELRSDGRIVTADPRTSAWLARHGLEHGRTIGATPTAARSRRHLILTSTRRDFDPVAAAREARSSGLVRAAVPNYRMSLHVLPNDTYLSEQWYIHRPNDSDIDLPEAWDVEQGNAATRIGVMDTGVDLGHPDLAAKIWTNPGEIPANSLDDDGNGYVDDVNGWDFGEGDNDPNPEPFFDAITGIDVGFHGTFVSALAAASSNNAVGIAGAAWNCRIVPLKVANAASEITTAAVTAAFEYATDLQLEVLNMSLGSPGDPGVPEFFQALVDDADAADVLCVASAGNDGTADMNYPGACDKVLCVGATDETNARAFFSNYGSWVDVAAPGAEIWSAICRNYLVDDFSTAFYLVFWYWDGENPYMFGDGTSFSCPLVAGVAGLVRSRMPSLTPAGTIQQIVLSGDAVVYDQPIGVKVNAFNAMTPVLATGPPAATLDFAGASPNPFSAGTTFAYSLAVPSSVKLAIVDAAGRRVRGLPAGEAGAGPHTIHWDGRDETGAPAPAGIYFARLEVAGRMLMRRIVRLR